MSRFSYVIDKSSPPSHGFGMADPPGYTATFLAEDSALSLWSLGTSSMAWPAGRGSKRDQMYRKQVEADAAAFLARLSEDNPAPRLHDDAHPSGVVFYEGADAWEGATREENERDLAEGKAVTIAMVSPYLWDVGQMNGEENLDVRHYWAMHFAVGERDDRRFDGEAWVHRRSLEWAYRPISWEQLQERHPDVAARAEAYLNEHGHVATPEVFGPGVKERLSKILEESLERSAAMAP